MLTPKGLAGLYSYFCKQAALRDRQVVLLPLNPFTETFAPPVPKESKPAQKAAQASPFGITADELLEHLKVSKATLIRRQKMGMPFVKNGNRKYYDLDLVWNWMRSNNII